MSFGGAFAQAFVRLRVDKTALAGDTSKGIEEGAGAADVESAGANAGAKAGQAFNKGFKATMVAGLAIAAIGAASLKAGVDFQSAMTKIQTQAGASKSQVAQLSQQVLQLAPSTQQGPQQLAEALYHLKSLGMDNATAMRALATASNLAAVGGSNLEETTNAIGAAWRSGIAGAQNFGQAAATVNAIIGAGNMKMQDFVSAMGSGILSAAKMFGVSLSQVGAAMALMTDEGVPAEVSAHRLRISLALLGAASPTAAKQLKTIGLTSYQLGQALRSGGFIGAIGLLREHLKAAGLDATQTAALLSRTFGGGQSSSAILTMINNFDVLKKKQDQINAGIGKYGGAVAAQRQTVQAQLDILKSSLETIGVKVGLALLHPFIGFVHYLSSTVIPAALRMGAVLGRIVRNPLGGAFLAGLAAALVTIKLIVTAMKVWETVQLLIEASNPIGIAIVAVAALAAGIAVLWARSATFRKIVEGAFHAVMTAAKAAFNWLKSNWPIVAGILLGPIALAAGLIFKYWSDIWRTLLAPVVRAFDAVKSAITGGFDSWWAGHGAELEAVWRVAWRTLTAIFNAVWGPTDAAIRAAVGVVTAVVRGGIALVTQAWRIGFGLVSAVTRAAWAVVSGVTRAAFAVITGEVKVAVALVTAVVKAGWDLLVGIFNVALDLLTGRWSKAWSDIQAMVTQIVHAIEGFLSSALSDILSTASRAWSSLISGLKSAGSDLLGYVRRLPGMILAALGDVGHMLWNAGVSIIKGLIGGIKSMIGAVGHAIGSVASHIKSFLPFSPAKQGALSGRGDPYNSGVSIAKKIAAGIRATTSEVKAAIKGTTGQMAEALGDISSQEAAGKGALAELVGHHLGNSATAKKLKGSLDALEASARKLQAAFGKASGANAITAATAAAAKAAGSGNVAQMTAALAKALKQEAAGSSKVTSLKDSVAVTQALRKDEESQIKKLIAARSQEAKEKTAESKRLRAEQEKEIKSLEALRAKQESSVKATDAVVSTLKKSLTGLKDEVTKLKEALKKAEKAAAKAAASSSSSSSSDGSSSSGGSSGGTVQTPDWGNLVQWLTETANAQNPADGGSWQGNPGPLGGFGLAFDPGLAPRPAGRFGGASLVFASDLDRAAVAHLAGLRDQVDRLIAATMAQPAKNAAGMAAALNGVSGTAIVRGGW